MAMVPMAARAGGKADSQVITSSKVEKGNTVVSLGKEYTNVNNHNSNNNSSSSLTVQAASGTGSSARLSPRAADHFPTEKDRAL